MKAKNTLIIALGCIGCIVSLILCWFGTLEMTVISFVLTFVLVFMLALFNNNRK